MQFLSWPVVLASIFFCGHNASASVYPKSLKEKTQLYKLLFALPKKADDLTINKILIEKKGKLLELASGHKWVLSEEEKDNSRSLATLLEQYIDVIHVGANKCNIETAADMVALIRDCNEEIRDKKDVPIMGYLQRQTIKQFAICKPQWDEDFSRAIEQLPERVKNAMQWLIDSLMVAKYDGMRGKLKRATRPYDAAQLRDLVASPPPAGILGYINRWGTLEIDENAKNMAIARHQFEELVRQSIAPLCRPVCDRLDATTQVYNYVYYKNLDQTQVSLHLANKPANYDLVEWLAGKLICCKLVRQFDAWSWRHEASRVVGNDRNLIEKTYRELTKRPFEDQLRPDDDSKLFAIFTKAEDTSMRRELARKGYLRA